jgi:cell wall-associated NlpC family hydrolase
MTDEQLIKIIGRQLRNPELILQESRKAGLSLPLACALIEQESHGRNVFGHDPTRSIPDEWKGEQVTAARYRHYKRNRQQGLGMQGVGLAQLTWYQYQDRADALGGCYRPEVNLRVGFSVLRGHVRVLGLRQGIARYNGSGSAAQRYADQVLAKLKVWRRRLRPGGGATPVGPYAGDFVGLCLKQRGDRYVFGAEAKFTDPDPDVFDCSELVEWALARLRVRFPDGSWTQEAHCRRSGTIIPLARAFRLQGALLFRHIGSDGHVAVSLGNGSTIEARGRAYGVNVFSANNRRWTAAARVPGLVYTTPPDPQWPKWPGRYLTQPPQMRGKDVAVWKRQMRKRGWALRENAIYGPGSEQVCREFQREKGLLVDGVVGPDSWKAAWLAPISP